MTNRPNEQSPEAVEPLIDTVLGPPSDRKNDDFSSKDLHLVPGKRTHRDSVQSETASLAPAVLNPQSTHVHRDVIRGDTADLAQSVLKPQAAREHRDVIRTETEPAEQAVLTPGKHIPRDSITDNTMTTSDTLDAVLTPGKHIPRDSVTDNTSLWGDSVEALLTPQGKHIPRDTVEVTTDTSDNMPDPILTVTNEPKKKKKKMKLWKKILLGVLIGLLVLILGLVIAFFVLYNQGRNEMLSTENMVLTMPEAVANDPGTVQSEDGRTVVYKGETYRFNENRANILCLGMDKTDFGLENGVYSTAGQADTIVVLSIDTSTGRTDALVLSRDTMTDINLYAEDGSFYRTENKQLCLAYAYGDGYDGSCKNMVTAVTRVLYGIPINTYFTINLSAIPALNDAVGGVTVKALKDFRRSDGSWCSAGDTITLNGDEAHRYIRERDVELLESNNERMERQRQYISAFFNKALEATSQNLQVPLDLFNTVSSDTITNLNPSKITFLATTLVQHHSAIAFHTVPGEVTQGADGLAEFHVDEEKLYEQILSVFFTKV